MSQTALTSTTAIATLVLSLSSLTLAPLVQAGSSVESPGNEAISPACLSGLTTELATIERVTDGDTVVLSDQRRVRLIGINSAELNAPNKQLKQAAHAAKEALSAWLPRGEPVKLFIGVESQDRHGRLLAHVTRDKDSLAVAQLMIQKGLAVQSAVAPNTRCAPHFAKLEAPAANAQTGLWAIRDSMSINASDLNKNTRGFKLILGTVTRVNSKKRFTEVFLDQRLRLLVRPKLAKQLPLKAMIGQRIEVRGWVSRRKDQVFMWLQNSANLRQLAR